MHSSFNFRSFQRRRSQAGTVIDGCLWTTHMSSKKRACDLSLRKRFAACSRKEVGEAFNFYSLICVLEAAWTLWKWKSLSRVWLFVTPWTIYSSWNSLGQNPGMGSHSLLQGIFLTQGSNPGLPHCRQILYQLNYKGSPDTQGWRSWFQHLGGIHGRCLVE